MTVVDAAARRFAPSQRGGLRAIVLMAVVVLGLTVLGWGTLLVLVVPSEYQLGSRQMFGAGLGLTAYTLGMRHAFDADHIAAIDNTTRKLMADGQRPVTVGFWFSLGHSSVVFALCALLAFGIRALAGQVEDDRSALHTTTSLIGTALSGSFLLVIGLLNLVVLTRILRVFRDLRYGHYDEQALEAHLAGRGLLNRVLSGATRSVSRPWHIYPVGLLFGLGFDTATEVSLLVLAGGAAAFALPWYAVLTLPVLFAAGMSLFDSIDGCFMNYAYGWAFATPVRKVFYNLAITSLSVVVALAIGLLEVLSLAGEELHLDGPIAWLGSLDLNDVGFVIVGLFVLAWAVALLVWRLGRIEQRWADGGRPDEPRPAPGGQCPGAGAAGGQ